MSDEVKFVVSTVRVRRSDLTRFELNFNYLKLKNLPFLSTYMSFHPSVVSDPDWLSVRIIQAAFPLTSPPSPDVHQLVDVLEAVRHVHAIPGGVLVSSKVPLRFTYSRPGEVRLVNWAHAFLLGSKRTVSNIADDIIPTELSGFAPKEVKGFTDVKDWLGWMYVNVPGVRNRSARGGRWTVSSLVEKDAYTKLAWMHFLSARGLCANPELSLEVLSKATTTSSISTHPANVSVRIAKAIATGGMLEIVQILRSSEVAVPDPDRLAVYSFVLGRELPVPTNQAQGNGAFQYRFSDLVSCGRFCQFDDSMVALGRSFFHRCVMDTTYHGELLAFLQLVDNPLAVIIDSIGWAAVSTLFQSVFACTLADAPLLALWDRLLVSSPDLLVRVAAFCLMEVRDLVLQCDTAEEVVEVVLTMGDLIGDFGPIISLAVANDDVLYWQLLFCSTYRTTTSWSSLYLDNNDVGRGSTL